MLPIHQSTEFPSWLQDVTSSELIKKAALKKQADYLSRLRMHIEEQQNQGTYINVDSALHDFSHRLSLSKVEQDQLRNNFTRYAQTLKSTPEGSDELDEIKNQGAPVSVLPGVKPNKKTNQQKVREDVAEDATGTDLGDPSFGPEGGQVQGSQLRSFTRQAGMDLEDE